MPEGFLQKIARLLSGMASRDPLFEDEAEKTGASEGENVPNELSETEDLSSINKALMGAIGGLSDFYFPPELIGGCCPRVVGEEEEVVWNAAAEAADTERVHLAWQAQNDKIWYLAVRSDELASHVGTWCPFVSLLPGMKDALEPPTLYTYFSDETATMMTVMKDGLQIHRGTTSVIRAKSERLARELGDAPIVELVPDRIRKLTPIPWYSLSLFENRARRILATVGVASAVLFGAVAVLIWLVGATATVTAHADLRDIEQRSKEKSRQLMLSVENLKTSLLLEEVAKFTDINDGLLALNGYLEIYTIQKNRTYWRALLPPNVTSERIRELHAQTLDTTPEGTVIGNTREALTIDQKKGRR